MSEAGRAQVTNWSSPSRKVLVAGLLTVAAAAAVLLLAPEAEAQVKYVAGSLSGRIAYSFDGITWTQAANNPAGFAPVWAVGFNGTGWAAAAGDGTAWTSPDGITWTDHVLPAVPTSPGPVFNTWGGMTWDGSQWVLAGGSNLGPRVLTSTDGANWVLESTGTTIPTEPRHLLGTTWNGNMWLSNGRRGFFTSTDGHAWTFQGDGGLASTVAPDTDFNVRAQIWCNGRWYAASTVSGAMTSSPDGVTWTLGPTIGQITKFATDGTKTVAVGLDGARVWTTTDYVTWTPQTAHSMPSNSLYTLAYGDGLFITGSWVSNQVYYSADGVTWTAGSYPSGMTVLGVASREGHQERVCKGARPDSYVFNEDQSAQSFDVRANDVTAFPPMTVAAATAPTKGTLSGPNAAGLFTYVPNANAVGADSFTYTATDANSQSSTTTVTITINPVNDAPSFVGDPTPLLTLPGGGERTIPGWGTIVQPGPAGTDDETGQSIDFVLDSIVGGGLFTGTPVVERTGSATSTTASPGAGDYAMLRFTTSGTSGSATVCFRIRDSGGTAVATNTWLGTATGDNLGDAPQCVDIVENAAPVAYFTVNTGSPAPNEPVTFSSCPAAIPSCSYDPDGAITMYLWEFGDGTSSSQASPRHTYQAAGTYLVRLSVWDNHGVQASYSSSVIVGWRDGGSVNEEAPGNGVPAPLADAGEDRTVTEGTHVTLAGTHKGGDAGTTFQWTQVGGPYVKLADANSANPGFRAPELEGMDAADLVFALQVWQGAQGSPVDHVTVHVVSSNDPPVAAAGGMAEAKEDETVTLDGTLSRDGDGDNLTYRWEQVMRPGDIHVLLLNANDGRATFTADEPGTYRFVLTVSDGKAIAQDTATVVVRAAAAPAPPDAPAQEEETPPATPPPAGGIDPTPLLLGLAAFVLAAGLVVLFVVRRMRQS